VDLVRFELASDLEVEIDRIYEWSEPGEKLLVHGMVEIGVQRGTVEELHDGSKLVAPGARGEVDADLSLENAGNLGVQSADFGLGTLLLGVGGAGLPLQKEGVNDHVVLDEPGVEAIQIVSRDFDHPSKDGASKGGGLEIMLFTI
jgi:hypothetical protein